MPLQTMREIYCALSISFSKNYNKNNKVVVVEADKKMYAPYIYM